MSNLNVNGREKAREANVKYDDISEGIFPEEVIVTISSSQGKLTAILPLSSIDNVAKAIIAYIIDEKDDYYLVDLPTYTFTSGSRVWLSKASVSIKGTA